jgi:hypothetical protein
VIPVVDLIAVAVVAVAIVARRAYGRLHREGGGPS